MQAPGHRHRRQRFRRARRRRCAARGAAGAARMWRSRIARRADERGRSDCAWALGKNMGMTDFPESHRDLLDAQVASLATIGGNGLPQLTEIWFLHEDGELKLSLNDSRVKTRNLTKRPQCSLLVL